MIVLGLGFGDEGKGLTTSYLCSQASNPTVVRFNGGHQAGHTVVYNDKRHVFSNFGSGTLQEANTYWSEFCTIHPVGFMNEWKALQQLGITPSITAHPLCPITTPYDVKFNHSLEEMLRNGSVGVGFGATIARQEAHYKLHLHDLRHPNIFMAKLKAIKSYYIGVDVSEEELALYMQSAKEMVSLIDIDWKVNYLENRDELIFEGAQGILLDMDHGFFPNVTRSNTTSKNAFLLSEDEDDIYYVTRCYQTRHGAGFMTNEMDNLGLENNQNETNIYTPWQGKLRTGKIDLDLINYAMDCDHIYHPDTERNINLVVTCLDQLPDFDIDSFIDDLEYEFDNVYVSRGPSLSDMEHYS